MANSRLQGWLVHWADSLDLFPDYCRALRANFIDVIFGPSVLAVIYGVWSLIATPPLSISLIFLGGGALLASYYVWRADHVRLLPKFELKEFRTHQPSTFSGHAQTLYIQVLPSCVTQARVNKCRGYLLRVKKWSSQINDWVPTELDQPLDLKWSYHDAAPRTLEPGIDQWLNLLWISNLDAHTHLETQPTTAAEITVFNFSDTYRFDIRIAAKNSPAEDISLSVHVGTQWDTPTVKKL